MVSVEASKRMADRSFTNLVEVWDIENSVLMETFVTRTGSTADAIPEPHELIGVDADTSPAAAIAALVRSRQQSAGDGRLVISSRSSSSVDEVLPAPAPDVRALVVGLDFGGHSTVHRSDFGELGVEAGGSSVRTAGRGFMVSGSEDRKMRLWDLSKLERTTVLSGLLENEKPSYQYVPALHSCTGTLSDDSLCSTSSTGTASTYVETWPPSSNAGRSNLPPQRMSLITQHQQNLLRSHQDVITALACIDAPFRGGIVSSDRAGVIKVWRVEQGD